MSQRKDHFVEGEFYHILNRGNSKQPIFLDDYDRDRFAKLLYICNMPDNVNFRTDVVEKGIDAYDLERSELLVSIGAWVLMPNHFHLFLSPRSFLGDNALSLFMKKLGTSYSMYFNKKYQRTGSLFEGKFKSVIAISDEQTKYNFSYIHLNPLKLINKDWKEKGVANIDEAIDFLNQYKWFSYPDYKKVIRLENKILSPETFPDYFSKDGMFDEEIFSWLENTQKNQ